MIACESIAPCCTLQQVALCYRVGQSTTTLVYWINLLLQPGRLIKLRLVSMACGATVYKAENLPSLGPRNYHLTRRPPPQTFNLKSTKQKSHKSEKGQEQNNANAKKRMRVENRNDCKKAQQIKHTKQSGISPHRDKKRKQLQPGVGGKSPTVGFDCTRPGVTGFKRLEVLNAPLGYEKFRSIQHPLAPPDRVCC